MMTNQAIEEISNAAFIHVRTLLRGSVKDEELTQEANDLVQNSWEKFLKTYADFFDNQKVAQLMICRIARNEALYYLKRQNQRRQGRIEIVSSQENGYYDYLLKHDMAQFVKLLNEKQLFIFKAMNRYEGGFTHAEITDKIQLEYQAKFAGVLTVDNYTQTKRRIKLLLLKFWRNDRF